MSEIETFKGELMLAEIYTISVNDIIIQLIMFNLYFFVQVLTVFSL
jgi:hypothetical protein